MGLAWSVHRIRAMPGTRPDSPPAESAQQDVFHGSLIDALEQVSFLARRLVQEYPGGGLGAAAVDAGVLARAAAEVLTAGSHLSLETARLAMAAVVRLRTACGAEDAEQPLTSGAIEACEQCQDAYLNAYLQVRGFNSCPPPAS